jgi:hypothetical protein
VERLSERVSNACFEMMLLGLAAAAQQPSSSNICCQFIGCTLSTDYLPFIRLNITRNQTVQVFSGSHCCMVIWF